MRARFKSDRLSSLGVVGKLVGTLFLGVFLAAGLFFFGLLGKEIWGNLQTYQWKAVEGRVLESAAVRDASDQESPYAFRIRFAYDWNGRTYVRESPSLKRESFSSYDQAQELADRFPAGRTATCWVNPDQPDQAVLIRGGFLMVPFLIIPLVFIVVGGGGIVGLWLGKTKQDEGSKDNASAGPISDQAQGKQNAGCLVVFFGIFLLAGGGFFFGFFVRPVAKIAASRGWVETPCVILSSEVQSHRSDDGTTYRVDILYRYSIEGREYKSSRYHFMGGSSSGYEGKREVVRRFPVGLRTVCYVNPDRPQEAVLERGWTNDLWFGLIPLVFVAVGLGGIIFAVRKSRTGPADGPMPISTRASRIQAFRARLSRGAPPIDSSSSPSSLLDAEGPVELKPRLSPVGKLLGIIVFAAFWNGIVSVFVWQVIKGWQRDGGGFMEKWFLPVFLIPFVLIGLGLLAGIVYQFFALFNARPRLRLSSRTLRLGETLDLSWRLEGRIRPVESLHIEIQGKEEATYRRGTSTHTDTSTFATYPVMSTSVRSEMLSGSARFAMPLSTMHSVECGHNKIVWAIHVHGKIRRWPDIKEEYVIEVRPRARALVAKTGDAS